MKFKKRLLAAFLAVAALCCGCSAGDTGLWELNAVTAIPLAEQGGSAPAGFTDVPSGAWYAEAAEWCRANGVVSGTTATAFSPKETMTHAMLLTILYRAAGSPAVNGAGDSWYGSAMAWSAERGLTGDYDNGQLDPSSPVTREQIAAILWRYADSPAPGTVEDYTDETSIASFAQTAVDWAKSSNIMSGVGGNRFDPKGTTTRAQTVAVLYRYLSGSVSGGQGEGGPVVYMTTDISSDGLMTIYAALNWIPGSKVAVKLSTGEPGSNYLRTDLIGDLVKSLDDPTIVECNTAYGGSRSSTAMHYQVAKDHGYTAISDVDIMDENGSMTLPVVGGENLTENYVGANFANYDSFLVLSHFKGHAMAGFGGAIKNISIGILASYDPMALDQACVDLVYAAEDGRSLINRMESRNGLHTLEHAEKIGLGSRNYQLVNINQERDTTVNRQIKLTVAGQECIATLYDNPSADDLYSALPLELTFEDYNQTEKISHPPKTLTTEGMPDTFDPDVGDLCLYAPWGNLCIFYRDFRDSISLIPLGRIDSGMDVIGGMTEDFTVTMEAVK